MEKALVSYLWLSSESDNGRIRRSHKEMSSISQLDFTPSHLCSALIVHLIGFVSALITAKKLYNRRLFPIIKCLLATTTGITLLTFGVSVIGSILMLIWGQSLSTCTLSIYNMSVAPLTLTMLTACLAIDRFYITESKVPNVRKMQCWNLVSIIGNVQFTFVML